ncbi:hypothetical protein Emag_005036 [Eimeria magna]
MVATRRTVRASTSAQRTRRVVARATPPRPKRSRSASTTSATRDAAGLPPRTRARRALLTTAADPTPLRRSLSPARSSSDRAPSLDTPLASRQLSPLRRVAVDPAPVPADLTQWRRGMLDSIRCPAVELAIQALDRPADAFHITMQQLHPRLRAHIRTCMTALPDPTRTPYDHMVAILIQQVAPGKPEDYLHQTIALIARHADTQISRLHLQFTEAYDAYRNLCARLRSPPHLGEHFVVTAFLGNLPKDIVRDTRNQASAADRLNDLQYAARLAINFDTLARTYPGRGEQRPQDANTLTLNDDFYAPPAAADPPADTTLAVPRAAATPRARRPQRAAPTPSELLREPPPASWAAAIHHLNQQAPRALSQPNALNSPVAMPRLPAPSLGSCFFCNAPDHGHRARPSYLRACQQDPTLASKCPACRAPGYCPVSCPRRQYFIRSTRFPYLEVDRFGHSYYIRADLPSPAWFHPGLLRAVLAHQRPAPQPQQPSVAVVQLHPGATDALPAPPDTADPRPTTPPPAYPPVAQRAVFCAAPPAPGAAALPPATCNHTRLGTPPRTPKEPTHTRAWATIDGIRCEVIIDTGADLSLISADLLKPHRSYQPWAPAHGSVTGVNNHALHVLGRVALDVRLGPLKTTAPFFVVPGVAFAALLGVDFLYEHEIAVSLARHALIFEGHGGQIVPLLGHHPRLAPLCALAHDVALCPGSTVWVRTTLAAPGVPPAPPLVYLVAASTLPGVGLTIPEQLTSGLIAIRNTADRPLHLSAGWPLAKAVRLPPTAIHTVRLVAADSAPTPADGAADAPSYERVPGGFIPTLPSPNSCLLPAELQQLRELLHEFRDRFNDGSEPLPATTLLKARLDTGDAQPISTPPRRLSPAMRQAVREAVADFDAQGITEPSTGCWSTPIVMVRKASGAWRLCCDYRAINKHVRILQQPLPRTDDILASFNGRGAPEGLHVDAAADTAWRALCKALSGEPVLAHLDYRRPFYLDCDGSGDGLGAVLLQPYDEGERVVAYASRSLLDHERKWTATELEAAALIWALETFRHYIDTIEVCIRTDHAPLEYIRHNSSQCRRLERWALRLQEFRFKVIHRPGAQQKHVDCLSRAPVPPTPTQQPIVLDEFPSRTVLHARAEHSAPPAPSILWCAPLCAAVNHVAHNAHRWMRLLRHSLRHMCAAVHAGSAPVRPTPGGSDDDTDVQVCLTDSDEDSPTPPMAQLPADAPPKVVHGGRNIPLPPAVEHLSLKDAQAQDPECQEFLRLARTPRAAWPPHLRHTPLQFCVLHDLVYVRIGDALPRVVLPAIFRSRAIQAHHLSYYGGHFGIFKKTAARLACRYWWPHLQRDVRAYFCRCPFCIANTDAPRKWKWLNLPIGTPFELIAIDLFGPLPLTRRGNNHILVIIDHHTRWVELVPLPNPTAAQVA